MGDRRENWYVREVAIGMGVVVRGGKIREMGGIERVVSGLGSGRERKGKAQGCWLHHFARFMGDMHPHAFAPQAMSMLKGVQQGIAS